MFRLPSPTQPAQQNIITSVCHFARQKDRAALRSIEQSGRSIFMFEGQRNALMVLAEEGDKEAVDFLLDEFGGSRNLAAMGYAYGGHVALADAEIAAGACVLYACKGYAMGGYVEPLQSYAGYKLGGVEEWLAQACVVAGRDEEVKRIVAAHPQAKEIVVQMYAFLGRIDKVDEWLDQRDLLPPAIYGFARAGFTPLAYRYLKKANWEFNALAAAIIGFARAGLVPEVDIIIQNCSDDHTRKSMKDVAAAAFASAGNVVEVNKMIAAGAGRDMVLEAYAEWGFIPQVDEQLAAGADVDYALMGNAAAHVYGNRDNTLRIMTFTKSDRMCTLLAVNELNSNDTDILFPMIDQSRRLQTIMLSRQVGFTEAKAIAHRSSMKRALHGFFQEDMPEKSSRDETHHTGISVKRA